MRNARLPAILSFLLLTLLVACSDQKPAKAPPPASPAQTPTPSAPAAAPAHLIIEGTGVGGISLGMSEAEVRAKLGKPASENKDGEKVVFMSYHQTDIFGVYFDPATAKVRMIILAMKDKSWCTAFDVCLYRDGDLSKLLAHHGPKLFRFTDRDGSVTLRLLSGQGDQQVMTEYTPNEEHKGVAQVAILYWTGKIDTSSFD